MKRENVCGVIVAAGVGSRMASAITKQQMTILSRPILYWTLRAFDECEDIDSLVVVTRKDEVDFVNGLIKNISKKVVVTIGGSVRSDSVKNGISASPADTTYFAIHDGARCLITPKMITDVVEMAVKHGAASAASSVFDTVKQVDDDGFITSTHDRNLIKLAGTPQVFRRDIYEEALKKADSSIAFTDDNSLVESIGCRVAAVEVGRENIKITEPIDLEFAELILKRRSNDV